MNDAQAKKEQLKHMARLGLKFVSVTVDYKVFPPRCIVECDTKELRAFTNETYQIMDMINALADRYGSGGTRQASPSRDETPGNRLDPNPELSIIDSLSNYGVSSMVDSEGNEGCRIRLGDSDSEFRANELPNGSNAPSVHLIVHLPTDDEESRRTERFVIDDFWDFVQIKFEDTGRFDLPPDLFELEEKDEREKFTFKRDAKSHSPEIEKLVKLSLLGESARVRLAKAEAKVIEQQQDELLDVIE